MQAERQFVYSEDSLSPLVRCTNEKIINSIINPVTGKPYEGIVLEGEFASLNVLNNNNRLYTPENYIIYIEVLKSLIHSAKGVYGHLEHPKGYATDTNEISHKLLDIYYDEAQQKVFGLVLLLNTPKGLIAQEIVKSGGQLAISARGGGSEIKNPDGTFKAVLKLLVTFDLVYHPGFSTSVLEYTKLFESVGMEVPLFEDNQRIRIQYIDKLNFSDVQLFESVQSKVEKLQNKKDEKILQQNKTSKENSVENELESAVDKQLSQKQKTSQLFESQKLLFRQETFASVRNLRNLVK